MGYIYSHGNVGGIRLLAAATTPYTLSDLPVQILIGVRPVSVTRSHTVHVTAAVNGPSSLQDTRSRMAVYKMRQTRTRTNTTIVLILLR